MTEVQKADPGARRRAVVLVVIGAVVGAGTIILSRGAMPAVGEWVTADPDGRLPFVAGVLAALPSVPLAAAGAYLWWMGGRVVEAGRFPPPGIALVRDAPVIEGQAAIGRGRTMRAVGLTCAAMGQTAGALLWRLLISLADRV